MQLFDLSGKNRHHYRRFARHWEAIARQMAEHGANVVVSSRKAPACDEVTNSINEKHPGRALTVQCNIGSKEDLQNLVDESKAHFGQVDILVCNAAVNPYFGPGDGLPR